jgi:hypothetical protein
VSRHLGSTRQYTRPTKPTGRELRRLWKAGLVDTAGNPTVRHEQSQGRNLARQESEIDPGVMADIRDTEFQRHLRERAQRGEWNVLERSDRHNRR